MTGPKNTQHLLHQTEAKLEFACFHSVSHWLFAVFFFSSVRTATPVKTSIKNSTLLGVKGLSKVCGEFLDKSVWKRMDKIRMMILALNRIRTSKFSAKMLLSQKNYAL